MAEQVCEPVVESSVWLDAIAPWTCRQEQGEDCSWYHGSWQYLRLLNLVSNPTWHSEFFLTAMRRHTGTRAPARVLISGCADYSMYAHVIKALGPQTQAVVLDWCRTPLIASQWYAHHIGVEAPTVLCTEATAHRPKDAYDLVVSDSFLPRFPPDQLVDLLQTWRVSLRPGGCVITTVRLHDGESLSAVSPEMTAARWGHIAAAAVPWWSAVSTLEVDELIDRATTFARRQERNAFFSESEIKKLFSEAGFAHVEILLSDVSGKKFARVQAF